MDAVIVAHAAVRAANRSVYRRLASRGVNVTLVVPDAWYSVLGGVLPAEPEPADSGVRLVVQKRLGKAHINLYALWPGLTGLIDRKRETAIYVDGDPPGFIALQAALGARRHRAGLVMLSMQNILKKYPLPFNLIQRFVLSQTGACVAPTRECEQVMRDRGYGGPISIMRFGYELAPLSQTVRDDIAKRYGFSRPAIGYIGRLVPEKGVDVLLKAAKMVPDASIVIGGDGPESEPLKRLARELAIDERVRFLGNLEPTEAVAVMGSLDVSVLCSRTTGFWKDQIPRFPIESMAQGVPFIGSSSGAIPELAGDAGLIFTEDSFHELAVRMREALDRKDELSRRSLERARSTFSLDQMCDALQGALVTAVRAAR
jgi:glycosyltransferase involved in cell wall biosynthesis